MYCYECGEKMSLVFAAGEGLLPYCKTCQKFRPPQYSTVVSIAVTNRQKDKFLLAKNVGEEDYLLFAGNVKKGETAEKAVTREFKEETKLDIVKYRYMSSRYDDEKDTLILNFLAIAEDGQIVLNKNELEEATWFSTEEALKAVRKGSSAEAFLKNAVPELKRL